MYKTILVNRAIEDGEKLVERLERKQFPVSAAFWRYLDEDMLWRLLIVSPVVDQEGPLRSYMHVTDAIDELGSSVQFGVSDVSVMGPSWTQFQDLRRTIESAGVGRIKAAGQPGTPQGIAFEDFYIYRWNLN